MVAISEKEQDFLIGVTDVPIDIKDKDMLDIERYVSGLVNFITHCRTPMTISMQGDWGTGKTSFINLIDNVLKDNTSKLRQGEVTQDTYQKVKTIKFNTWKYAQFNQEQYLHISFLNFLISNLLNDDFYSVLQRTTEDSVVSEEQVKSKDSFLRITTNFAKLIMPALVSTANVTLFDGQIPMPTVPTAPQDHTNTVEAKRELMNMEVLSRLDSAHVIESLRNDFQEAINICLTEENCDRIVIFIDDLDRLEPKLAVRLLEVIKLFLDVDNCVFVLAVDYDVVIQGLLDRFAKEDKNIAREKAQSFFDKMIQVPFHIPTQFYQFQNFIFNNVKSHVTDIKYIEALKEILDLSVGHNPRAVKRLLNSFYLISSIARIELSNKNSSYLLATLCAQLSYTPAYRYLANKSQLTYESFIDANDEVIQRANRKNGDLTKRDIERNLDFIAELFKFICHAANTERPDSADDLTEEQENLLNAEVKIFKEVLTHTRITDEKSNSAEKQVDDEDEFDISLYEYVHSQNRKKLKVKDINFEDASIEHKNAFTAKLEAVLEAIAAHYNEELAKWDDTLAMLRAGVRQRFIDEMVKIEYLKNPDAVNASIKSTNLKGAHNGFKKFPTKPYFELSNTNFKMNKNNSPEGFSENIYPLLQYIHPDIPKLIKLTVVEKAVSEE